MTDQEEPSSSDRNPYASSSRWRHQESTAFADYAAAQREAGPRDPTQQDDTLALADYLNTTRIDTASRPGTTATNGASHTPIVVPGDVSSADKPRGNTMTNEIVCGPLLNYRGMRDNTWRGSALIVVRGGGATPAAAPTLMLRRVGAVDGRTFVPMSGPDANPDSAEGAEQISGVPKASTIADSGEEPTSVAGMCLYSIPAYTFWAFDLSAQMEALEVKWEYWIPEYVYTSGFKPRTNSFFVPASTDSMRVMFFSCNGFSVGTDEEAWCGPVLWKDVYRRHEDAPFHVM